MEELKRIWLEFSLKAFESGIHARLPWDTADSRFFLWLSVGIFIVIALIACRIFGELCGWIFARFVSRVS
jgi:hypothetical protein